ncbi:hypothetical protein DPV78_001782, partial [Talaromyces pinophilus]
INREKGKSAKEKPVKFKDAVGRKYNLPFILVKTWTGIEDIIRQAFLYVEVMGILVTKGHYDLVGPHEDIIFPHTWETRNYYRAPIL